MIHRDGDLVFQFETKLWILNKVNSLDSARNKSTESPVEVIIVGGDFQSVVSLNCLRQSVKMKNLGGVYVAV